MEKVKDTIYRQDAIDAMWKIRRQLQMLDDTHKADRAMHGIYLAKKALEQLPPAPERKTGKWIANGDIPKECPFCGEDWDKYVFGEVWYTGELPNFCPNCGADMRGE